MTASDYALTGETAIVTGSSRGLGKAMAARFSEAGADVVICAPEAERENMDAVADSINSSTDGGRAIVTPVDVTDRPSMEALAETTEEEFGGIDILVNNAGGGFRKPFRKMNREDWDRVVDLNLGGTFNGCNIIGNRMADADGGVIINMASMAGLNGSPKMTNYAASKAAIINFTRTLSFELAPFDVRVNAIAPGLIKKPTDEETRSQIPFPDEIDRDTVARRIGLPEEIAEMAQVLASPAASFVTGTTIEVAGVPRLERHLEVEYYDEGDNVWVLND